MASAKADLPPRLPQAELFTGVRGIEILRTSPLGNSANFALTAFSEKLAKKVAINTAIE
jgi:hypothetical protein